MVNRMLASMTAIPAGAIKRGKLEKEEWDRVAKAASELRSYNMHLIDETVSSTDIIETVCAKQSVGLTVVDYAGILADVGDNTVERMGTISRNMKALSMPNYSNAPVALVTQLNRASEANEDSRPLLSNIKDSDAFGADATVVLFPFRPYYFKLMKGEPQKDVEEAEIIIAKNRNGPVLTTKAKFYPATMKWEQKMS